MKQTLKYILSVVMENLKYAEGKHAVSIALSSAIIVFVSGYLMEVTLLVSVLSIIAVLFYSVSIVYNILALMSRNVVIKQGKKRKRKKRVSSKLNLTYFQDIVHFDALTYLTYLIDDYNFPKNYKVDSFEIDLAQQILLNARVVNLKFIYYNKSIQVFAVGLVITLAMVMAVGFGV